MIKLTILSFLALGFMCSVGEASEPRRMPAKRGNILLAKRMDLEQRIQEMQGIRDASRDQIQELQNQLQQVDAQISLSDDLALAPAAARQGSMPFLTADPVKSARRAGGRVLPGIAMTADGRSYVPVDFPSSPAVASQRAALESPQFARRVPAPSPYSSPYSSSTSIPRLPSLVSSGRPSSNGSW